jgi:hypothetical protein
MQIVGIDVLAFEYASQTLRGDREIVMKAVKQWGLVLEHASDECKKDLDIVKEAIKQQECCDNAKPVAYAHESLKSDPQIGSVSSIV